MKGIIKRVWKPFILTWQEVPWFGSFFSAVLVALAIALLYDALKEIGGLGGTGFVLGFLFICVFSVVSLNDAVRRKHREKLSTVIRDRPNPAKCKGLIILISTLAIAREAIRYHEGALQCCWLIATPEMKKSAKMLDSEFSTRVSEIIIRPLEDRYDSRGCYDLVLDIYNNEAVRLGLLAIEVMSDITGGTKPMSAAMMLAALGVAAPMEHVPTEFDPVTKRPKGPLPPIEISVTRPLWQGSLKSSDYTEVWLPRKTQLKSLEMEMRPEAPHAFRHNQIPQSPLRL